MSPNPRSAAIPMIPLPRVLCAATMMLTGCALEDSHIAHEAQHRLMGLAEVELESCLGAPDQHSTFGNTDILTYYAQSTSNSSFAVPVVGGFSFGNGGYCHVTFQLKDSAVTQILYSGEKNATFSPDAYCAPILRTCMAHLDQARRAEAGPAPATDSNGGDPSSGKTVP